MCPTCYHKSMRMEQHVSVAYHIALYSTKKGHIVTQHIFTTVTGSPAVFGRSQIVSLVSALSMVMCPLCYNVDKYFSQSCEKCTDAIKHSDTTASLISLHNLYCMELLHNLQHCSHILTYTTCIYTCTHTHKTHLL